jgi:predicted RNA binding protein YcfA (HicA-like mRNA interferase family)
MGLGERLGGGDGGLGEGRRRRTTAKSFAPYVFVCMMRTMKSADLIRELKSAGWMLDRVRGSHHVFTHPDRGGHIVVPHPKKDLGAGLVAAIRKQAKI